jgi:hypothetical protein
VAKGVRGGSVGTQQSAGIGVCAVGPSSQGIGAVGEEVGARLGVALVATQPDSEIEIRATPAASQRLVLAVFEYTVECAPMAPLLGP